MIEPHLPAHDLTGGAQPAATTEPGPDRGQARRRHPRTPRRWVEREDVLELLSTPTDDTMMDILTQSDLNDGLESDPWDRGVDAAGQLRP